MKSIFFFMILYLFSSIVWGNNKEVDSLLMMLDKYIHESYIYNDIKENRIKTLKQEKTNAKTDKEKIYNLNKELYKEYKAYISDSAIFYLNQNIRQSHLLNDLYKLNETTIELAEVFASSGMYKEAFDALGDIDKNSLNITLKTAYFKSLWKAYEGLAFYTQDNRNKGLYWKKVTKAKDS